MYSLTVTSLVLVHIVMYTLTLQHMILTCTNKRLTCMHRQTSTWRYKACVDTRWYVHANTINTCMHWYRRRTRHRHVHDVTRLVLLTLHADTNTFTHWHWLVLREGRHAFDVSRLVLVHIDMYTLHIYALILTCTNRRQTCSHWQDVTRLVLVQW